MNRKAVIIALAIVLLLVGYSYTYLQVLSAARNLKADATDVRITGLSLLPPSVDIVYVFTMRNPSGYDLEMRIDGGIYYDGMLITPLETHGAIKSYGTSTFEVPMHITGRVVGIFLETLSPTFTFKGTRTITHRILGIVPVVFSDEV